METKEDIKEAIRFLEEIAKESPHIKILNSVGISFEEDKNTHMKILNIVFSNSTLSMKEVLPKILPLISEREAHVLAVGRILDLVKSSKQFDKLITESISHD